MRGIPPSPIALPSAPSVQPSVPKATAKGSLSTKPPRDLDYQRGDPSMYFDFSLCISVFLIHAFTYVYTCRDFDTMDTDREIFCVCRRCRRLAGICLLSTHRYHPHHADLGSSVGCLLDPLDSRETHSLVQAYRMTMNSI